MPAPITDSPIFTAEDLVDLIEEPITAEKAAIVESVVWSWLKPVLELTERPNPPTEEIFGWAIELGAIFSENPSGLTERELGAERAQYSAERRAEILDDAGNSGPGGGAPGANTPRGDFPPPTTWPCGFWQ